MILREAKNKENIFTALILVSLFQAPLGLYVFSRFSYYDEFIALLSVPLFVIVMVRSGGRMIFTKGQLLTFFFVFGYFVIGWISWRSFSFMPLSNALIDSFGTVKFFFGIASGWLLFRDASFEGIERRMWPIIRVVATALFILTILDEIFKISGNDYRYGLMSVQLFFGIYTFLAATGVLISAILIRLYEFYGDKVIPYLLMDWFVVCMTLRTKAIGAVIVITFLFFFMCRMRRKVSPLMWIAVLAMVVLVSYDQFEYYFVELSGESARFALNSTGPKIAMDYFPIGTGWASFGSMFSIEPYSPVYHAYGLDTIWGLTPSMSLYVADCYWPMILAQTGFIGGLFYVLAVGTVLYYIMRMGRRNASACVSGLSVMIYLLISSTSEAAFTLGFSSHYALWLGFLFAENSGRVRVAVPAEKPQKSERRESLAIS